VQNDGGYDNNNNDSNDNNGDSTYGPFSGGYTGTESGPPYTLGTPNTDPATANLAEFAPSILVYLKDGTMLAASDYWLADGQFHYTVKYGGENAIAMDQVDIQRTTDENAKRGVKFTLKNKPATNLTGTGSASASPGASPSRGTGAKPAKAAPLMPPPATRTSTRGVAV
jgi:hypothetical protein